jgi:Cu+-exporting ATPase
VELRIDDLKCPTCSQTVEAALGAVPGVSVVTVNRTSSVDFVDHDPARVGVGALYEALKAAGYRTGSGRIRFRLRGMTCASCVTRIEQALRATPGALSAHVSLGSEEALVEYVPATTDLDAVRILSLAEVPRVKAVKGC